MDTHRYFRLLTAVIGAEYGGKVSTRPDAPGLSKRPNTPERFLRGLEALANVVIVCLGIGLCFFFVRREYFTDVHSPKRSSLRVGERVRGLDIRWQDSEHTLVLALSTRCQYCTDSAPFYRRLVGSAQRQGIRVVAALPQASVEAHAYLRAHDIPVAGVHTLGANVGISGFPTVLLVDQAGAIEDIWVGKLRPPDESRVQFRLAALNGDDQLEPGSTARKSREESGR
jgi:hypothetical protein